MTEALRSSGSSLGPEGPNASSAASTGAAPGFRHLALRWWPAIAGLALGMTLLVSIEPWRPSDPTTVLLPMLAIAHLVFGAVRGQLRRRGMLTLQTVGVAIFGAGALLAVLVDPGVGHYIAGAGWIGHAAWDVAHHRDLSHHHAVGIVPRGTPSSALSLTS